MNIEGTEYKPCNDCDNKQGMYTLCPSCYHNRTKMEVLKDKIRKQQDLLGIYREYNRYC